MNAVSIRETYGKVLAELGKSNADVVVLDADTSNSTRTLHFAQAWPDRFFNFGIAEANMMGVAAGLACSGKTVVTYSIIPFSITRCLEQIKIDICYHKANVKIVGVGAGFAYGPLGMTHHAIEDIALMRAYPSMRILSPCDPGQAGACVDLAYQSEDDLELVFDVVTEHGHIKCKHPLYDRGDQPTMEKTQEVLALFGLSYPDTFEQVADLGAQEPKVRVYVGEFQNRVYGKINAGARAKADPEKIKAAIARAKGESEDVPF